jgi:hypothetical protein
MAGPARFELENLEERRLLSGMGDAVGWDLKSPINGELSAVGEVDYYRFNAQAGEKIVFDSVGMKQVAILDSDGSTELDQLFIFDGALNPTPGRLVWDAPHAGTFYVSVSGYRAFLVDVPTGPYSLAAYPVNAEEGPVIGAGQTIHGSFSSAGDIDSYSFDARAGTVYRFEITSEQAPGSAGTAHFVMGVIEAQPWTPMPQQPQDAQEAYPGHNIRFTNLDGQRGLGTFAEWIAPASGRYHFSIAPLDGEHVGAYTLVMSQRPSPCDPQIDPSPQPSPLSTGARGQEAITEQRTPPKSSSHSARHPKPRKHHRRPAGHKHEKPSAKEKLQSARQKLLLPARD